MAHCFSNDVNLEGKRLSQLNAKKLKIKRFKQPQSVATLPPFGCLNCLILTS